MNTTTLIKAYKSNNAPDVYIQNYSTLINLPLYFEIIPPYTETSDIILEGLDIDYFTITIGGVSYTTALRKISITIQEPGIYYYKI